MASAHAHENAPDASTLAPSRVYLEGWEVTFDALVPAKRWNGWAMPLFTKAQIEAFARAFTRPGVARATYFAPTDTWTFWSSDGYVENVRGKFVRMPNGNEALVYDMGELGWTWLVDTDGRHPNPLPGKSCCASCAAGKACTGGCSGHAPGTHAHGPSSGARPNPIYPRGFQGKATEPVFAVGEANEGECTVFGCGNFCEGQTPAPPRAIRFESAKTLAGGGYELVTKHEAALPEELQALYARGACKGEACLPWFRVQPVDPERYRVALEAARKLGPMTSTTKVVKYLREYLLSEDQEVFVCLSLDVHGYVRGIAPIARGARDAVMTPIPDILRVPVTDGAYQFLVAHNHPSGNPKPSKADLEVTKAIKAASVAMNILFVDHLVIARRGYYSFADAKKV